jgi:hypothetical protein
VNPLHAFVLGKNPEKSNIFLSANLDALVSFRCQKWRAFYPCMSLDSNSDNIAQDTVTMTDG